MKPLFARYHQLSDSLEAARSRAKNQFALIRYESEKNRADNLRLQQENAEKRVELLWGRILLFGSIAVFVTVVGWLVGWFRKRTRNRIRDHQLRTSQKVHDVVANGLYSGNSGIMSFGHLGFMGVGAYLASILTMPPALKATILPNLPAFLGQAHMGVAALPVFLGEAQGLSRLDPEKGLRRDVWLGFHRDLRGSPAISAVSRFLLDCLPA